MKILIVAGGPQENWPKKIESADIYVGIDHGSLNILENNWPLTLAVGDFDSSNEKEREKIFSVAQEVITAKPEKDDTDTQLALVETFKRWPQAEVLLIGATGGRLDHLLANIWVGLEPRFTPFVQQIAIGDQQNYLTYILPGKNLIQRREGFKYLAYCCLTPVKNLTLRKSKYLLDNVQVAVPTSYTSNEFIGDMAECQFDSGVIAVIQSKDI